MRCPVKRTHALVTIACCVGLSLIGVYTNRDTQISEYSLNVMPIKSHEYSSSKPYSDYISSSNDVVKVAEDYMSNKLPPEYQSNEYSHSQPDTYDDEIRLNAPARSGGISDEDENSNNNNFENDEDDDDIFAALDIDEIEYETSDDEISDYEDSDVKKIVGHKRKSTKPKQQYVTNRINGFIREVANCNATFYSQSEIQSNPLCATPQSILTSKPIEPYSISGVNNPCFFLRQSNRERGDRGWTFKLATSNINVMDGETTLNLYKLNCLPGAFLAGFPKSGTTELHARLSQHHQIYGALRKEVSWFDNGKSYEQFFTQHGDSTLSLYAYMRMFAEASQNIENDIVLRQAQRLENELSQNEHFKPGRKRRNNSEVINTDSDVISRSILLDSSPGNYDAENLRKIAHMLPNSKVIFLMRDPVEREFSKYRFHFQLASRKRFSAKNQNPDSFHNYVLHQLNRTDPMKSSTSSYYVYIKTALQYFKRENLLFLVFEEFVEKPMYVIENKVLPFLGLNSYKPHTRRRIMQDLTEGEHANPSKQSYQMYYKTKVLLRRYFSPFNRKLADLLKDDIWTWGY